MSKEGSNVEELCRLCAAFDPVKMPIFSSEGQQRNLVAKISTCLKFKVAEDDNYPKSVCYRCMFNLENFFDFYESCLRAQKLLQAKIVDSDKGQPDEGRVPPLPILPNTSVPEQSSQGGVPNVERPFPCDLCPTSFMSAKDRWLHVSQNHKGDARITCIFCRKGFSTISNLNFHKKNKHPEEMEELERRLKPLPKLQKINELPKIQNKTYETVRTFLNNKTEHILQDAKQSDLANFNVKIGNTDIKFGAAPAKAENRSMIDRLKNLGVEVSTGNVKNNDYFEKFENPEDLLDIEFDCSENFENMIESETVFGCEVCLRDFKDRSSLWLHMLYSHKAEAGFTCGMCLKLCMGYKELHEHVIGCKEQTDNDRRRYYCTICYRQHESKKKLETHTAIHNLNDPYIQENYDLTNLVGVNPTAAEKQKGVENPDVQRDLNAESFSDRNDSSRDGGNDSTQHSLSGQLTDRDKLAYQSFFESTGHFLESSSFFDNVKKEDERMEQDEIKQYACDECYRSYDTVLQLTKHKYNVHKNPNRLTTRNDSFGNPVYECEICCQTFENPKILMKHRFAEHRQQIDLSYGAVFEGETTSRAGHRCVECPRVFDTPRQLQKHRYNVHKSIRRLSNQPGGGESPSSVESIKPVIHYSSSFDCELCGEKTASKTERWKHCFKEHRTDERLLCTVCGKVSPTEAFKKEHDTFHGTHGKQPICCEICCKLWGSKVEYWKHVSGVHYSLIGLTCGVCYKMFLVLDDLKEHVKTHMPLSEAEFNCDICGRGYSSKPKMTRHRLVHDNDPDADEYNILKHTLLKGGATPTGTPKYEILNIPKVRNYAGDASGANGSDLEVIEVNPDGDGLDNEPEEGHPDHLWCDVCPDLTFNDLDELRAHRRNIHALYPCDLCPKFYGGVSHLWKHTNRSHKNHPDITCMHCGKTSASRLQLKGHINKNHKEILLGHHVDGIDPDPTNLHCRRCNKEFRIRSLVRRHERTCLTKSNFDPDPTNLNCQKCGKYYPIRSLVRRHEKVCLNRVEKEIDPLYLTCKVCGKEFPKRSYCRRHERTCGTKKERPKMEAQAEYICEWCPKVFTNRRAYTSHVDYMHSVVECEICTEEAITYRSKVELYNHIKEKHGDHPELLCDHPGCQRLLRTKTDRAAHVRDHRNRDNPPTCEFCADIFKGRKKLRIHILHQHKGENTRKFICGICVKVHDDTKSLMAHVQDAHGKMLDRDFTCRICARTYNSNAKVFEHIRKVHDGTFKACKLCLDLFETDTELEDHMKEHKDVRIAKASEPDVHPCGLCDEQYETVVLLHEHVKSQHPDLKENSCLICGKKYASVYSCYEHMDNKHGSHYYPCRKCLMLFENSDDRTEHLKTHGILDDKEAELVCTQCNTKANSEEDLEEHIAKEHKDMFEEMADRHMCLICSKVLKYKYSIFVHVEKHHKNVHCCRTCLMIYRDKTELDVHYVRMHKRQDGNPPLYSPKSVKKSVVRRSRNQCAICMEVFEATEDLRLHVAAKHPAVLEQDATCAICGNVYSSRLKVSYHVHSIHGDPYKCCRKCCKIFLTEEELKEHEPLHANETPKAKKKRDEEPVLEVRTRPRRSRSKVFKNYVMDVDEVDEDDEEASKDKEEESEASDEEEEETKLEEDEEDEDEEDEEEEEDEDDDVEDEDEEEEDEEDEEELDEMEGKKGEEEEDEEELDEKEFDEEEEEEEEDDEMSTKEEEKTNDGTNSDNNYTCEAVSDSAGNDDQFKLKIKHNVNSLSKTLESDGEATSSERKRKLSEVINGAKSDEEENVKRLMKDIKSLSTGTSD